jgi:hypothetical protein
MPTFRVHLADGTKHDVDARTPTDAASAVKTAHPAPVAKIKRVKEAA